MKYLSFVNFEGRCISFVFEEIRVLIEKLSAESGCSVKPLMQGVHIGHSALKGVYMAKLSTCCTM